MVFLKILDDTEQELELTDDDYGPGARKYRGAPGRATKRA